jgi:DnaJ-class molecular chaperone
MSDITKFVNEYDDTLDETDDSCPECSGLGYIDDDECPVCDGMGYVIPEEMDEYNTPFDEKHEDDTLE